MSPIVDLQARRHRLTVKDYHRMGEAGVFSEDDRVELIEGELIDMTPIGSRHAGRVNRLQAVLSGILQGRAVVTVQNPVILGTESEPQPDVMVLKVRQDFYESSHPHPQDVLLLIEVADTTDRYDRDVKVPLYARHGISEVWLLDLPEERLEVYHGPEGSGYRHVDVFRSGSVSPKAFSDVSLDLGELGFVRD